MASGDDGVAFPLTAGARGTTATGKGAFADAARVVDAGLATAIEAEADWRGRYLVHARRLLEATIRDPAQATAVAGAGLDSLHRRMVHVRDGDSRPLHDALAGARHTHLGSVTVAGRATGAPGGLEVPYRGKRLSGDALQRQLDRWVELGTVEPSFAEAVRRVAANPDWLDLSDRVVAVLGAGAEMGPLASLCRWGARVIPLDLPHPELWGRILATVRLGRGRATVPVREPATTPGDDDAVARVAGADLVTELPEVAVWLREAPGPLTLGNYAYADGATHVRVAMAVDALTVDLARRHRDLSLAVLATPTDVFAAPEAAVEMARRRFAAPRRFGRLEARVRGATRERLLAPNYREVLSTSGGVQVGVADCLVPQQGQNYALAKRLQRWRATVARARGHVTSVNVAAPTRTRSVMRNRALAAAYRGAWRFGVEVFDPPTSNTLMAALLVHDLRDPTSVARPTVPLAHPLELFARCASHGGLWRIPFAPRSVLGLAVALGMLGRDGTPRPER